MNDLKTDFFVCNLENDENLNYVFLCFEGSFLVCYKFFAVKNIKALKVNLWFVITGYKKLTWPTAQSDVLTMSILEKPQGY